MVELNGDLQQYRLRHGSDLPLLATAVCPGLDLSPTLNPQVPDSVVSFSMRDVLFLRTIRS